ncbi:DUF4230 domain-containing protein [Butyrivibrio sp. AE2032]|uniref:DUF4230 domain-containing protein n=1 Tax=Butyrivibrio sp. AE2032 TaxID=1458463 RepID=UPI00055541A1|nr:DUF4230 domain-containing protein [Butyrivibrio sp. AE2032]
MENLKNPKNTFYLIVIGAAVLAMLVLCIMYSVKEKSAPTGDSASVSASTPTKKEKVLVTVSVDTVEDGLRNMGTLITQEYYFTQVEKYTKDKKVLGVFNSSSELAYSYEGSVTAGIDFEKIELEKDDETKTITVVIPPSEIQNVNIDKSSFKVFSEKDSLWNPMNMEDYNDSLKNFEEAAKQKALDSGILERSDEQAQLLINGFIRNYSAFSDYEIDIRQ